jgi:hypothetical protein
MPDLARAIATTPDAELIAVVAGGSFSADDIASGAARTRFLERKRDFYRFLPLHPSIEAQVGAALAAQPEDYLGLHLRYTDRGHQAPLPRDIRAALRAAAEASGLSRVFVASDTPSQLLRWHEEVRALDLEPWSIEHAAVDREDPRSAHAALTDWQLLGRADRLVYFAESSYATEAAVSAGAWDTSIALAPHAGRAAAVRAREYVAAGWRRLTGSG